MLSMPLIQLRLQGIARGQQLAIAGRQVGQYLLQTTPKRLCADAGSGQNLLFQQAV